MVRVNKFASPSLSGAADVEQSAKREVFVPLEEGVFSFGCHRGISCFTKCCAKLRLILMPYDILRMRSRLGLRTEQFLERYTDLFLDPAYRFPMVRLKMKNDPEGTCPFVTPDGCSIYDDRPAACRLYPVGRASALPGLRPGRPAEKYFLVRESHCKGFEEDKRWEVAQWLQDQGVTEYDEMNEPWLRVITAGKSLGPPEGVSRKYQVFYLASYDLDRFHDFTLSPGFLKRFDLAPGLRERIREDDGELLRFACDWLRFSLYGEKSIPISPAGGAS
ncbi:MAG: YkgJ family cysteine cluster protein [Deltaproteobacteria bacterium]|nr:YkgJ family cysteine cluster protein [Deltaproteobacteria bacterium]